MALAFVDRDPSASEVEKLRLVLSTFQDGTGMLLDKRHQGRTLPGWRDFERSVAVVFNGIAQESKFVFDVLLPSIATPNLNYGLSCKMGNQLDRIDKTGRAFMELSNSSKKFWDFLRTKGIDSSNYKAHPQRTGASLIELVERWHHDASREQGGIVDITKSFYLVLSYNSQGSYQLHLFPLQFPPAETIHWRFLMKRESHSLLGNLRGYDEQGLLFEWYGDSGGQLKYYPRVETAIWASTRFQLEPLEDAIEQGILAKARTYFPYQWRAASESDTNE